MTAPTQKDRGFDAYLEGDSPLSRAYAAEARELPPAHLDAAILAEAHRAGSPPARAAPGPFAGSWMVPASLAAVIVVSVSIVALLPDAGPGLEPVPDIEVDGIPAPSGEGRQQRGAGKQKAAPADEIRKEGAAPKLQRKSRAPAGSAAPEAKRSRPQTAAPALEEAPESEAPESLRDDARPAYSAHPPAATPAPESRNQEAAPARATGPQARIREIEALVERGEIEAARRALEALRSDHPGAQVPPRILELLGEKAG